MQFLLRLSVLFSLFCVVSCNVAFGSHIAGSEITYTCTGPNQYLVKLVLYRDCQGISAPTSAVVNYSSATCGVNASIQLSLQSTTDITPLCPSAVSACNGGGGALGIEQIIYTGTLTLPNGCSDWILSYDLCCRNGMITNLTAPESQEIYVQTTLNNTLAGCNSSPQFSSVPQLFGCVGTTIHFQQLASDPDGDQLVYSLINAQGNPGTSVTYTGGFNGPNPFNVAATIDPNTGEIVVTPSVAQVAVISILVQEYRNGILIGSVIRDLQINIASCTNDLPEIGGINGVAGDFDISVCANATLCFTVAITDADAGQTVNAFVSNLPSGATINITGGGNNKLATICWTPTDADVGSHFISFNAEDDACPLIGENSRVIEIIVTANPNAPVNAGVDVGICDGSSSLLTATSAAGNISSIVWSPATGLSGTTGANVTASPSSTTMYSVTMSYTDGCSSQDNVLVTVYPDPVVSVSPGSISVCSGGSAVLTGTTNANGMTFQWFNPSMVSLGTGVVSGVTSTISVTAPVAPGSYDYTIRVTDPVTGCNSSAVATLVIGSPPALPNCVNIYASPTGSALAPGTQASPTTLAQALSMAQCNNAVIKLAIGTYTITSPLTIGSYVTLEGGFDPGNSWGKTSLAGATTINRTVANPEGAANAQRLVAFYANSATDFRLQDLTITTAAADQFGESTYALHLTSCSNYDIVRTQLLPGAARVGAGGAAGAAGINGRNGGNGSAGDIDDQEDAGGGGGGGGGGGTTLGNPGSNASGNYNSANNCTVTGGTGGLGGTTAGSGGNGTGDTNGCGCCNGGTQAAAGGTSTNSRSGGGGGGGGNGGCENGGGGNGGLGGGVSAVYGTNNGGGGAGSEGNDGANGAAGTSGTGGAVGSAGPAGSHVGGFWVPGTQGGTGASGTGGQGGRGGGGGGGQGCTFCIDGCGSGGGGGGGGGQGGAGGTGGRGGGSSFGLYLYLNGAGGYVSQARVVSGALGAGGSGGFGGVGGAGGTGGSGSPYGGSEVGGGGNGGAGGSGGTGGSGGSGAVGQSISVHLASGSALATNQSSFNLAAQPTITVSNVNCTNINVNYASAASNNWDFDLSTNFASPATGTGTSVNTQYSQIARYSVSYGANVYEGFHNISFDGSLVPDITTNATLLAPDVYQICQGDYANFASVYSADSYTWNFNGAIANPGSVQNVNSQFNTSGYFAITLNLTTDCCGLSNAKTIYLHVVGNPTATGSGAVAICDGEVTILTISGLSSGNNLVWSPTSDIVTQTANTITVDPSASVNYLATITPSQTAGGTTAIGCPLTLNFPVTVNPIPDAGLTSTNIVCNSDGSATSTPSPVSLYNYSWSNGSTTINGASSTIVGLLPGNYSVTITNAASGCQIVDSVFIYPSVTQPNLLVVDNVPACEGSANGEVQLSTVGGTPTFSINFDGTLYPNTSTLNPTNLAGGTYVATVIDNLGCASSLNVVVPEIELPEVTASAGTMDPCGLNDGVFYISGTDGAQLTYNVGGPNDVAILDHHGDSIVVNGISGDVTLTLVSVATQCSQALGTTVTFIYEPCPLGVSLINFSNSCVDDSIRFEWATASEEGCDYYTIEGSSNGMDFDAIATIAGSGTTQSETYYNYTYFRHNRDLAYFRLSQTDYDGTRTEYPTVSVDCEYTGDYFNIYPNPNDGEFVIELALSSPVENAEIKILDMSGRLVKVFHRTLNNQMNMLFIDAGALPSSVYFVEIYPDGQKPFGKIIRVM